MKCYKQRTTHTAKCSSISHSLQVTNSLSLTVLILYLAPPAHHICCIMLCTCHRYLLLPCTSFSSVPPAAVTHTLRHASMVPEWNKWDGYQSSWFCSVILLHCQTQLMNAELLAHADGLRHWQKPSATGSQVGANPSSPNILSRQRESNTCHPYCH